MRVIATLILSISFQVRRYAAYRWRAPRERGQKTTNIFIEPPVERRTFSPGGFIYLRTSVFHDINKISGARRLLVLAWIRLSYRR